MDDAILDSIRHDQADRDVARRRAEAEGASARLEVAQMRKRLAFLLCQHEPVASMGIDRDKLRIVFGYVQHGDMERLKREASKGGRDGD